MGAAARSLAEQEHEVGHVADLYYAALEEAAGGGDVNAAVLGEVARAAAEVGLDDLKTVARRLDEAELAASGDKPERSGSYGDTLETLLDEGTLSREMSVLVVCGGPADADVFRSLGFTDVTVSNLDTADADTFHPYRWRREDAEALSPGTGSTTSSR